MGAQNSLLKVPPYSVEEACRGLGANLRRARVRRRITVAEAAERIGTGPRAVMDAEKGKLSSGIATYVALLWLYDLLGPFKSLASPEEDEEGLIRSKAEERVRSAKRRKFDNDF